MWTCGAAVSEQEVPITMSKQCHTGGHARATKDLQPSEGFSAGLEPARSRKVMKKRDVGGGGLCPSVSTGYIAYCCI